MAIYGASLAAFATSRNFYLSEILLFFVGVSMITQLATTNTLLQRMAPDEIRGRVFSVYTFVLVGLAPIGSLLLGAMAQRIGAPWAVRIGGAVCFLGAIWLMSQIPKLRVAQAAQQTGEVSPPAVVPPPGA
jgi:MFS family permease